MVYEHLQKSHNGENINEAWRNIKCAFTEAAKQTVGEKKRKRNDNWFDQECMSAINAKTEARRAALRSTRGTQRIYKEKRRIVKKICRRKKKEAMNKRLEDINKQHKTHNIKRIYELIGREKRGHQLRLHNIKSKTGKMLTEKDEIANRWTDYFRNIFNREDREIEEKTT